MSSSLIPADIMKMLGNQQKMDNREMIISHLVGEEGSVVLNDKQKELLNRWNVCDDLMRSLRYTTKEVCFLMTKKFGYSAAAAWRDIEDARFVFGNSRKPNKKYLLSLHIDRIEAAIVLCEKQNKKDLLPKLYDSYAKALALMPPEVNENQAPTAIVFNITAQNSINLLPDTMTPTSAAAIAAARLKAKGIDIGEYIPFTET